MAESLAEEIRHAADQPVGAHPEAVARALGFEVEYTPDLPAVFAGISFYGHPLLTIRRCGYPPREAASVGHELAEGHIERKLPRWHEEFCDTFASCLLLPRSRFLHSAIDHHFDIAALRRVREWRFASWELIGHRIAALLPGFRFLAWEDGSPKHGQMASAAEVSAVRRALAPGRGRARVSEGGWTTDAWHLTSKGETARAVSLSFPSS